MRVAIGSDHGGYRLKQEILALLTEEGIPHHDFGTYSPEAVDYPDIAAAVAKAVAAGEFTHGIVLCGTGIGACIAANKIKGIRAALCHDTFAAQAAREHNDANVLTMGERVIGPGLARLITRTWLNARFTGDRHARRVDKIKRLEEE